MTKNRIVRKQEANEKGIGGTVVGEYFLQTVPNLGLATATINAKYPPENEGAWAINERVDLMYYTMCLEGLGNRLPGRRSSSSRNPPCISRAD